MSPAAVPVCASVGDCESRRTDARAPALRSSALARPKSSTFTLPSGVSLTFAGLRSRWTMPFSCASSSASAICRAIGDRLVDGQRPALQPLGEVLALDELHRQEVRADAVGQRALSKP